MNLADSFYIALCMTVLLLGVVYWFWTQTQYLQRKMNLLENIVYELKTMVDHGPKPPAAPNAMGTPVVAGPPSGPSGPSPYPPPPGSELGEDDDLLHERLHATVEAHPVKTSEESLPLNESLAVEEFEDLQPGGVGSGLSVEADASFSETLKPKSTVLDGMTLKELRRLAEQRNILGGSAMRKQALIDALRSEPKADAEGSATGSPVKEPKASSITMLEETTLTLQ